MIFEYSQQRVFTEAIDVVDPGNMCLRCTSLDGGDYFIITKTVYGKLHIIKLGPLFADSGFLIDGFSLVYRKADYKEATIAKEVNTLVNDPKKKINEVTEILAEEVYRDCPSILEMFQKIE